MESQALLVGRTLGLAALVWTVSVAADVGAAHLRVRIWSRAPASKILAWIWPAALIGGLAAAWNLAPASWDQRAGDPAAASAMRLGLSCLYLAGWVAYLEARSLLSRGYSIRILVDLMESGAGLTRQELKENYGSGMGLRGLVEKRLDTLFALHVLCRRGPEVSLKGPWGVLLAWLAYRIKSGLRMESAG